MSPDEYFRIPYIMVIQSVRGPDGRWVRRAEYPELPGCAVEAQSPLDALDRLELARTRFIEERLARGEPIPVPRRPLRRGIETAPDRNGA